MTYEDIKDIANAFRIKCSKYYSEDLTPELCDMLFDEAYNQHNIMNTINRIDSLFDMAQKKD